MHRADHAAVVGPPQEGGGVTGQRIAQGAPPETAQHPIKPVLPATTQRRRRRAARAHRRCWTDSNSFPVKSASTYRAGTDGDSVRKAVTDKQYGILHGDNVWAHSPRTRTSLLSRLVRRKSRLGSSLGNVPSGPANATSTSASPALASGSAACIDGRQPAPHNPRKVTRSYWPPGQQKKGGIRGRLGRELPRSTPAARTDTPHPQHCRCRAPPIRSPSPRPPLHLAAISPLFKGQASTTETGHQRRGRARGTHTVGLKQYS